MTQTTSNFLDRTLKAKRQTSIDPVQIVDDIIDAYKEAHPISSKDNLKFNMLSEIIARNVFDMAGNRFSAADDGSRFSSFTTLFKSLHEQGITGPDALTLVLSNLQAYTKGFVQTPHPTEVLSNASIAAEQQLHECIEAARNELKQGYKKFSETTMQSIVAAANALFKAIKPLEKGLTIRDEMKRSVLFSEKMFDAIPLMMQGVLDAAKSQDAYNPTQPLGFQQLAGFNYLLQPETWSPGDRDSKSEMTTKELIKGLRINKHDMQLHYIKSLLDIIVRSKDAMSEAGGDLKEQLREITSKFMLDIPTVDNDDNTIRAGTGSRGNILTSLEEMRSYIAKNLQADQTPLGREICAEAQNLFEHVYAIAESDGKKPEWFTPYKGEFEPILELIALRDGFPPGIFPDYTLDAASGRKSDLNAMEVLAAQMGNFGRAALSSQIRENRDMHEQVMQQVLNILAEPQNRAVLDKYGIPVPEPMDEDSAYYADTRRAERIYATEKLLKSLMDQTLIEPGSQRTRGDVIHDIISARIEGEAKGQPYETLKGMETAAKYADCIPRYLVAECEDHVDLLEAFTLLKLMEPNEKRYDASVRHVEIVPLFEHRTDVTHSPQTIAEAYRNKYFAEHHINNTNPNDPAIQCVDSKTSEKQPMTVADAKRQYSHLYPIEIKAEDEHRIIKSRKMVMYAGSDITKSAGGAGAALVMLKTRELFETLLNQDPPILLVDYTGCGGGIHRSQPVSSRVETVQGRSLRQDPDSIAQKAMITSGRFTGRLMNADATLPHEGVGNDKQYDALTAMLNLGNMAGKRMASSGFDTAYIMHRLNADMTKYQSLYKDSDFKAYMAYSADAYAKFVSFAARANSRLSAGKDKGNFPKLIDVEKLRAIGYGLALNASGTCAVDYYGASEFLHLDNNGDFKMSNELGKLIVLYRDAPSVQDRLNRAAYGVMMADMDAAWKYLGMERELTDGKVVLHDGDKIVSCAELATMGGEAFNGISAKLVEHPDQLTLDEKRQVAMHILAKIDIEYQHDAKALLAVVQGLKRDAKLKLNSKPGLSDAENLLEEQPAALREQIRLSLKHIKEGRHYLAETYASAVQAAKAGTFEEWQMKERYHPVTQEINPTYEQTYYAAGVVQECCENVPRAYTRIQYAVDQEQQYQQQQQQNAVGLN